MGKIKYPPPAKLIMGILEGKESFFSEIETRVIDCFGPIDLESAVFPFDFTDYYEAEMGQELFRKFISFHKLIPQESLPDVKLFTNSLEGELSIIIRGKPCRRLNLDPGYLTDDKVVLATTKNRSHRIYMGQGIYADPHLRYYKGVYQPFEWTYPNYRTGEALDFFLRSRKLYLDKILVLLR